MIKLARMGLTLAGVLFLGVLGAVVCDTLTAGAAHAAARPQPPGRGDGRSPSHWQRIKAEYTIFSMKHVPESGEGLDPNDRHFRAKLAAQIAARRINTWAEGHVDLSHPTHIAPRIVAQALLEDSHEYRQARTNSAKGLRKALSKATLAVHDRRVSLMAAERSGDRKAIKAARKHLHDAEAYSRALEKKQREYLRHTRKDRKAAKKKPAGSQSRPSQDKKPSASAGNGFQVLPGLPDRPVVPGDPIVNPSKKPPGQTPPSHTPPNSPVTPPGQAPPNGPANPPSQSPSKPPANPPGRTPPGDTPPRRPVNPPRRPVPNTDPVRPGPEPVRPRPDHARPTPDVNPPPPATPTPVPTPAVPVPASPVPVPTPPVPAGPPATVPGDPAPVPVPDPLGPRPINPWDPTETQPGSPRPVNPWDPARPLPRPVPLTPRQQRYFQDCTASTHACGPNPLPQFRSPNPGLQDVPKTPRMPGMPEILPEVPPEVPMPEIPLVIPELVPVSHPRSSTGGPAHTQPHVTPAPPNHRESGAPSSNSVNPDHDNTSPPQDRQDRGDRLGEGSHPGGGPSGGGSDGGSTAGGDSSGSSGSSGSADSGGSGSTDSDVGSGGNAPSGGEPGPDTPQQQAGPEPENQPAQDHSQDDPAKRV